MGQVRLQFVVGHDLAARAIAWWGSGGFSHVDACWPDGRLLGARSDKSGGQPAGVRLRPDNYEPFRRRVIFTLAATAEQENAFRGFLTRQIGRPYDRMAILGFFLNRSWKTDSSWICSELQAAALEAAGLTRHLYVAVSRITPGDLALVLSALGATHEEVE